MANVSVWMKALKTIPRITKEEWLNYDIIAKWLIATRSAVFIMTALASGIGGLFAFRDGEFILSFFVAALTGLVFAHAANNLVNDLIDYKKRIDRDNYYRSQYGPQTLEHGFLSVRQFYRYILVTLSIALGAGIYLVFNTGIITLILLVSGLFFLFFYTWPLKYIGLGEPTILLVWGPLMVGGTYYVATGGLWPWEVALIGLVYAMGSTAVLFGKHTDKILQDREKGVHTLPVIIGEKASRIITISLWMSQYAILITLVVLRELGPVILVVLLALPKLNQVVNIFSKPRPLSEPDDLAPNTWPLYLSAHAFVYNRRFGMLFLAGLITEAILDKAGIFST
ncbi:MAG: prenyltransferase [Bacteroidales bacterium]|nr:MAG: prenyltransferase [Bacteroidales bacterium]